MNGDNLVEGGFKLAVTSAVAAMGVGWKWLHGRSVKHGEFITRLQAQQEATHERFTSIDKTLERIEGKLDRAIGGTS